MLAIFSCIRLWHKPKSAENSDGLSENPKIAWLHAVFEELGIRTTDGISPWSSEGFPVSIPLPEGEQLIVDLPSPGLIGNLDPKLVGVAVADGYGRVTRTWGLAKKLELLQVGANLFDSPLHNLVESAAESGDGGSLFLDGYRYFSASTRVGRAREVVLLVCDAGEELQVRTHSAHHARSSELFRRIGKALTMHQTLNELAVLSVHEIASACGLAAVLLWARSNDEELLTLRAHVGANRQGAKLLNTLEPDTRLSCAAELVASKRQTLWIQSVSDNVLTNQLEARFCYLQPRSVAVLPLMIGDRIVGVLELVGREGDSTFSDSKDLFETLAEHMALALNTALMFENAERLASFDPMTGVANHRALQDFLATQISQAERNMTQVGLLMLDVDHFRAFNEEEGHDAGDFVLKKVAEKLKEAVRPYDLPARYGGEEFSAVLPGLDITRSFDVAERVRKNIETIEYVSANGRVRHVTASIGVSSFPETSHEASGLFKAADVALFKAKRAGRNRSFLYEGQYKDEVKASEFDDIAWMAKWQTPEDQALSDTLWEYLKPFAHFIATTLMLSKNQASILEHLIRIYPGYKRMMAKNDPELMRQLELAQEFRPLLPSLLSMHERYDGSGPMKMAEDKIPLLARVLAVLMALAEEKGEPFARDPHRFDPEIVALVTDLREAA